MMLLLEKDDDERRPTNLINVSGEEKVKLFMNSLWQNPLSSVTAEQ